MIRSLAKMENMKLFLYFTSTPFDIMGEKLCIQFWVFDLFIDSKNFVPNVALVIFLFQM